MAAQKWDPPSAVEVELLLAAGLAHNGRATAGTGDWLATLKGLNTRDQVVLILRHVFGLTREEVAEWVGGVSHQLIYQYEQRGLKRLRERKREVCL